MRGKRPHLKLMTQGAGLIPAHAGKTHFSGFWIFFTKAHPRACGENFLIGLLVPVVSGSSPRMRGKQIQRVHHGCMGGLIPAHAGKTLPMPLFQSRTRAHPRACGENFHPVLWSRSGVGSSPRMRGKHQIYAHCEAINRLIPAHAGKTYSRLLRPKKNRAHPRACGENELFSPVKLRALGSSPRMRGKR